MEYSAIVWNIQRKGNLENAYLSIQFVMVCYQDDSCHIIIQVCDWLMP